MAKLNYNIFENIQIPNQEKTKKPVRTKTALSMQATLENALGVRQPLPAQAPQLAVKNNGFGRSM